jgi:histidine triad (HIT) family protein
MVKDCIFCKIASGEIPSEEKIYENDNFFSVPDANQQVEGHSLVISKRHFETVLDLPSTLGTELLDCIKKTALILIDKHKAEGFNVVNNSFEAAGQAVKHVHFHILPRKKGGKSPKVY